MRTKSQQCLHEAKNLSTLGFKLVYQALNLRTYQSLDSRKLILDRQMFLDLSPCHAPRDHSKSMHAQNRGKLTTPPLPLVYALYALALPPFRKKLRSDLSLYTQVKRGFWEKLKQVTSFCLC